MNWLLLAAAIIATATTLIHAFLGSREVARPLLQSQATEEVKLTMCACWHMVTAVLGLTAISLLLAGSGVAPNHGLARFLGVLWTVFALIFLFVTLAIAKPRGLFRFPQWTLLLPVGILAIVGSL